MARVKQTARIKSPYENVKAMKQYTYKNKYKMEERLFKHQKLKIVCLKNIRLVKT